MEKILTVERCKISEEFARKYNFGDRKYPAKIIFDPKLGRKRIEEAQAKHEAKCAEIRGQNAEIDERNEVGEANTQKRNQKCVLTGYAIGILCFVVVAAAFMCFFEANGLMGSKRNFIFACLCAGIIEAPCSYLTVSFYKKNIKFEEFTPEKHIEYSDSVESFYTINEFFAKWWQEDFTMLELCFWVYRGFGLSLLAVDKDDVIHKAEFKFDASPEIVIKRNQSCIEFDLLNNRIIIPYVASEN